MCVYTFHVSHNAYHFQILSRAKRWAESQAAFAACVQVETDDFQRCRAWLGTAVAAKMSGDDAGALAALGEAESMGQACAGRVPQASELLVHVRMLRAAVLKGQGDAAGAARIVEDVIKTNPKVRVASIMVCGYTHGGDRLRRTYKQALRRSERATRVD